MPAERPTTPELSPALAQLLDSDGSPDAAAQEIAITPALRGEARAALPALKAMAEHRAGEEGVYAVISRRFGTLGKPALSEAEYENWWADYYDTCADLPLAALEAGMRAHVASAGAQFIPKPGELRHLAETAPSQTLRRYQRAKRALQIAAGEITQPVPRLAPDPKRDAEIVGKLFTDFGKKSLAGVKVNPLSGRRVDLPNTAGKPNERGLTPEMRAVLARQAAQENKQ